jgi:hypothetical protein
MVIKAVLRYPVKRQKRQSMMLAGDDSEIISSKHHTLKLLLESHLLRFQVDHVSDSNYLKRENTWTQHELFGSQGGPALLLSTKQASSP